MTCAETRRGHVGRDKDWLGKGDEDICVVRGKELAGELGLNLGRESKCSVGDDRSSVSQGVYLVTLNSGMWLRRDLLAQHSW